MLYFASSFNQNIGCWNVARAVSIESIFQSASAFNQNIASWNVASLTRTHGAFAFASAFNQPLASWNVVRVTGMGEMLRDAAAFNQNIATWNVLRVGTFVSTFDSTTALSNCNKGAIYAAWGATFRTAYPGYSSMCGASCSLTCLIDSNIGTAATAWITSPSTAATTYGPIGDWDVSAVSNMYQLFYNKPTFNGNIGAWNVASVTTMQSMA